jgi:DNA-binding transcriptional regulator GbsR (MarR family)
MYDAIAIESLPENETQIEVIRDLMLDARMHGAWMTLAEIAEATQYGEASISAQLRHLRKPQHGHYVVEKRRRYFAESNAAMEIGARGVDWRWEYQVQGSQ